ncbi:hypothetical protein HN873_034895 [Arachis hypogaea]
MESRRKRWTSGDKYKAGSENPNLHHAAIYLTVATLRAQDRNQAFAVASLFVGSTASASVLILRSNGIHKAYLSYNLDLKEG